MPTPVYSASLGPVQPLRVHPPRTSSMPSTPATVEDASREPPSPPSPTASFYDMSDDSEGEYSTIRHSKSGKGVKLLFAKSKVYVHPTPSAKDNVPGWFALMQQKPGAAARRTSSVSSPPMSPTSPGAGSSSGGRRTAETSNLLLAWVPESSLGDASSIYTCLLYTSPSPRDGLLSRMPSSA